MRSRIDGLTEAELRAPYRVEAGILGHFCDSLHDLTAHILMWVEAGRHIPSGLLLHRFESVTAALIAEIEQYDETSWSDPSTGGPYDGSIGALAEYAATPPDGNLFSHATRHLVPAKATA